MLDATVFGGHDRYLESTAAQALRDESVAGRVRLAVPEVVLIESDAKHRREVKKVRDQYLAARERLNRLRAPQSTEDLRPVRRYRDDLEPMLRDVSGEVLPIPDVPHLRLVQKAAERQRPFDDDGDGYRDALVWETVLALLERTPEPVMLVSNDHAAFARSKDQAELAPQLVKELRERGHARRAQLYFDLKAVAAELPRVREVASLWRHKISENLGLRDALIRKLLEVAGEDAPRFIAAAVLDDPTFRNPRFVEFSNPQGLQVQEAWVSQTGSVLLDVELRVDYRLDFEVLTRPLPLPQTGPYAWVQRTTSRAAVLTFEVVQHEPESEPTNFAARLTGFADPGSWVFAGLLE